MERASQLAAYGSAHTQTSQSDHCQRHLHWACELENWTMEQQKKAAWSDKLHFLLHHVDGWVCVRHSLGKRWHQNALWEKARWQRQGDALGNVLLGNLGSWRIYGHVDATLSHITYQNILADYIHPFMAVVVPNGSGLFQQHNDPATLQKLFRKSNCSGTWQRVWGVDMPSKFPRTQDLLLMSWCQIPQDTSLMKSMPPHGQSLFKVTKETYILLGWWI